MKQIIIPLGRPRRWFYSRISYVLSANKVNTLLIVARSRCHCIITSIYMLLQHERSTYHHAICYIWTHFERMKTKSKGEIREDHGLLWGRTLNIVPPCVYWAKHEIYWLCGEQFRWVFRLLFVCGGGPSCSSWCWSMWCWLLWVLIFNGLLADDVWSIKRVFSLILMRSGVIKMCLFYCN